MNVILSIKPKFVKEIFEGRKIFEYRKIIFKKPVDKVYIYSSSPVCRIVGEFKIKNIITDTPENLWEETKEYSGITRLFFDSYFEGKRIAYALKIENVVKYSEAIHPNIIFDHFTAPQSFVYTELNLKY